MPYTIQFHGHVHPATIPISVNELTFNTEHSQERDATIIIRIQDSVVHVTCTAGPDGELTDQNVQALFFRALPKRPSI